MKRIFLTTILAAALLGFSGCTDISENEKEFSTTNTSAAYICFAFPSARTIMPSFDISQMTNFSLYGKKSAAEAEIKMADFATYTELLAGKIGIRTGTWYSFKLTAQEGNTQLSGSLTDITIEDGENKLSFTLKPNETQSVPGSVNVRFVVPNTTDVKSAKAGLYTKNTDELYQDALLTAEVSDGKTTFAYNNLSVPNGTYRLKAWFYADIERKVLVKKFSELVTVVGGKTSEANRDINGLNKTYTITLTDGSYINDFTPTTLYTRYEGAVLPKASEMYKDDFVFLGWFTTNDDTCERITEIPASKSKNVVVYAKWGKGCVVTPENYASVDIDSAKWGNEPYTIQMQGIWGETDFEEFAKNVKNISNERSVCLDMSKSGITAIGARSFANCSALTSIIIPESVTTIGKFAFSGCSSLQIINIPNLTSIEYSTFKNCSSLSEITLPNTVTRIEDSAFEGCSALTSIIIPESVTAIGDFAFEGCSSLENVTINGNITTSSNLVFINYQALTHVTFGNGVTQIPSCILYGCSTVTTVDIPSSVTSIGRAAFSGCTSLSNVTIPNSLTTIDIEAFKDCASISNITIPNSVTSIAYETFSGCTSLSNITISNSLTSIGSGAFEGCTSLSSVTIPNSVTTIGHSAFSGCTSLSNITIPNSVKSIYSYAFKDTLLKNLTSITLPSSLEKIGEGLFEGWSRLETITIPDTVTKICSEAFKDCTLLKTIIISNSSSLTTIGESAFENCSQIEELTLPDSVTSIGENAFNGCSDIKLGLGNVINSYSPDFSIKSIKDVSKLVIKEGVEKIRSGTFRSSDSLKTVYLPSSLKRIESTAFENCSSLNSVIFTDTSKSWVCSTGYGGGATFVKLDISITDPAQNATNLSTQYINYVWDVKE